MTKVHRNDHFMDDLTDVMFTNLRCDPRFAHPEKIERVVSDNLWRL
jgi:hypothetical protein